MAVSECDASIAGRMQVEETIFMHLDIQFAEILVENLVNGIGIPAKI